MFGISISSPKKIDFAVLLAHALSACVLVTVVHPLLFVTAAYLFGVPAAYLAMRTQKQIVRDLLGAVLLGPVFGFMFDVFGFINGLWTYHERWFLMPARLWGTPLDILAWSFLWALYLVVLYEHFFEPPMTRGLSRLYWPMLIFTLAGIGSLLMHRALFIMTNAYVWSGLFSLWPIAAALYWRRALFVSILPAAAIGLVLNIAFEWSSCTAHYWTFGAHYIGVLTLGGCTLPVEEVIFWVLATPLLVLCNFLLFVRPKG